ncbi:M15 family metallopeptidase [Paraflavitalea sp. CAU 1676]|uniref:M15 family metallopeptidase n=1 Tax=Paraflavitalea sp. CAU 1676 TaxID=3032598 RepID=UPI0023D98EBB|nr:M15 family metallopeptidase [Paraflavitalea sp. CAU 1676]MDF2193417.1 M15 family metallopeptidase [Paraflavitalea sp. CAU 1676]
MYSRRSKINIQSIKHRALLALTFIFLGQLAQAQDATAPNTAQRLLKAYPDCISVINNNQVIFKNGIRLPWDDGKQKTLEQQYAQADLQDQLNTVYVKGKTPRPAELDDPGRIRNDSFFKAMYGATPAEVQKNFVTITWLPKTAPQQLKVTRINGVDKKLQAVSDELEKLPAMLPYLQKAAGTYSWRVIKGTTRLSTHSYGIAIDINTGFSNYWQWDNKTTDESKKIPQYINRIPWEIVEIFEKHGFIWGGKWYHYDTMHFEYRPELLAN